MSTAGSHGIQRSLAGREQRHRRVALLAVAALLILGTSPVFGHHLASQLSTSLAGRDHLLNVCLVALHELLAPVHSVFHVLLIVGIGYAILDRLRAANRARGTLGRLEGRVPGPTDVFAAAARHAGVRREDLLVVDSLPVPAFTAGWLRPRIYLATGLRDALTQDELVAVLAHEQSHLVRRDPLRLFTLRFLACLLFYVPALRRLADDLADEAEIVADDAATAHAGVQPLALASAILALAKFARLDRHSAAVGFHRDGLMERRIRRLAGEEPEIATHVTRKSLVGAGSLLVAVWVSGLMMAHPLPDQTAVSAGHGGHSTHCEHHGAWAFSHLFCRGFTSSAQTTAGGHCPHAGL
jgi:Zn-dependent protease with chaperone function